jgi:hypothetical protein
MKMKINIRMIKIKTGLTIRGVKRFFNNDSIKIVNKMIFKIYVG